MYFAVFQSHSITAVLMALIKHQTTSWREWRKHRVMQSCPSHTCCRTVSVYWTKKLKNKNKIKTFTLFTQLPNRLIRRKNKDSHGVESKGVAPSLLLKLKKNLLKLHAANCRTAILVLLCKELNCKKSKYYEKCLKNYNNILLCAYSMFLLHTNYWSNLAVVRIVIA